MNAILEPSGDHVGPRSSAESKVNRVWAGPVGVHRVDLPVATGPADARAWLMAVRGERDLRAVRRPGRFGVSAAGRRQLRAPSAVLEDVIQVRAGAASRLALGGLVRDPPVVTRERRPRRVGQDQQRCPGRNQSEPPNGYPTASVAKSAFSSVATP